MNAPITASVAPTARELVDKRRTSTEGDDPPDSEDGGEEHFDDFALVPVLDLANTDEDPNVVLLIANHTTSNPSMCLQATRKIELGEELLVDYGQATTDP